MGNCVANLVPIGLVITEIQRCENDVFVLPVNILTGVAHRLLEPHDTLPCVMIQEKETSQLALFINVR